MKIKWHKISSFLGDNEAFFFFLFKVRNSERTNEIDDSISQAIGRLREFSDDLCATSDCTFTFCRSFMMDINFKIIPKRRKTNYEKCLTFDNLMLIYRPEVLSWCLSDLGKIHSRFINVMLWTLLSLISAHWMFRENCITSKVFTMSVVVDIEPHKNIFLIFLSCSRHKKLSKMLINVDVTFLLEMIDCQLNSLSHCQALYQPYIYNMVLTSMFYHSIFNC